MSIAFDPAPGGKHLTAQFPDGARYIIDQNVLGEVHLIREAQSGWPFWSTELARLQPSPSGPAPQQPPQIPPPQTPPVVVTPPSQPAPQPGPVAISGFKPLNRVDVRVDRVVVARGYPTHQVHAFFTVKNTSASPQYFTGWLKLVLADADGASLEASQPFNATREPAELFAATPVIQPGGQLRARYIFRPEIDAQLTSITLTEGGQRAEFPVNGL
ncbi:MAG TPA: hypothetical protein VEZ48_01075 [Sphingomonadaceae bacterium]|nr:hypothetical protein [Sphingomonadaceae bacterium]